MMNRTFLPSDQAGKNTKLKYLLAFALVAGPLMFTIGFATYSYSYISALDTAESEWKRYKAERNNFLDVQRAKAKAQLYQKEIEAQKLEQDQKESADYFANIPAVLRSLHGATLVNFGKLPNGEPAKYSYSVQIGQATYNVQGSISPSDNGLVFEDDYSKTNQEVMSSGDVMHEKDPSTGLLTVQFITTKNIGQLSKLGDIKTFSFKYK
jgi:hypothetical protein